VSGLYCLIATSSPTRGESDEWARIDIVVNGVDVAYLAAKSHNSCTSHAVVNMNKGDKAYIKLNQEGVVGGGWNTSFSDMLVQPDL
jgi:hypothetical protein